MSGITCLSDLSEGSCAIIKELTATGSMRRRLQDIGFIPGTSVECVQISPLGDPVAYMIRGAMIALRSEDSCGILVCSTGEA